jgi:hypothetical protein
VATERRYDGPGRFDDGTRYTNVLGNIHGCCSLRLI